MRFPRALGAAAFAAMITLIGCAPEESHYPATTGCSGTRCVNPTPTGGTTGKDGGTGGNGGTGGAAATVDQSGSVAVLATSSFTQASATPFTGLAKITAVQPSGATASVPYGGANGTTFTFKGLESGPQWFLVEDQSGGAADIFSTFSYQDVPTIPALTLPVVDAPTLRTIANALPSVAPSGVSNLAAHVILFVTEAGTPKSGVKISGGSGGGQVAYDFGAGYSDSASATGVNGVAILFNAGLSGTAPITLLDTATNKAHSTHVEAAAGAVTLAAIALQ